MKICKKTVREWFQELREDLRVKAMASIRNEEDQAPAMSNALTIGLKKWEDTPEGFVYWETVALHYWQLENPAKVVELPD